MENEENLVEYTSSELKAMRARGEDRTDWERVRSAPVLDDDDDEDFDWSKAVRVTPERMLLYQLLGEDMRAFYETQQGNLEHNVIAALRAHMNAQMEASTSQ